MLRGDPLFHRILFSVFLLVVLGVMVVETHTRLNATLGQMATGSTGSPVAGDTTSSVPVVGVSSSSFFFSGASSTPPGSPNPCALCPTLTNSPGRCLGQPGCTYAGSVCKAVIACPSSSSLASVASSGPSCADCSGNPMATVSDIFTCQQNPKCTFTPGHCVSNASSLSSSGPAPLPSTATPQPLAAQISTSQQAASSVFVVDCSALDNDPVSCTDSFDCHYTGALCGPNPRFCPVTSSAGFIPLFCGDGICSPLIGENAITCPFDCMLGGIGGGGQIGQTGTLPPNLPPGSPPNLPPANPPGQPGNPPNNPPPGGGTTGGQPPPGATGGGTTGGGTTGNGPADGSTGGNNPTGTGATAPGNVPNDYCCVLQVDVPDNSACISEPSNACVGDPKSPQGTVFFANEWTPETCQNVCGQIQAQAFYGCQDIPGPDNQYRVCRPENYLSIVTSGRAPFHGDSVSVKVCENDCHLMHKSYFGH